MTITIKPALRASAIGAGAAAALIGSFLLGTAQSGSAATGSNGRALLTSSGGTGKITVTGTGTVNGAPNQLVLSMGVQANAASVSSALTQANQAASRVIAALRKDGVSKADIQTSGLSIQPNYQGNGQVPVGYGVSEQLTATLTHLGKAGSQIQNAATAGGNATTVDSVSLNLTDTSGLLAQARSRAIHDAQAKASQFASALGEHVTGVISVSDQSAQVPLQFYAGAAVPKASAGSAVPVSPGSQQISVQVTVVYAIG
ncbi:MAG TPA: SIMPL domain-containing protein [Streptosporangiaceae bacterium]